MAKLNEQDEIEVAGQLIDMFEDFLHDRNVELPSSELRGSDQAIIFGEDYYILEDGIKSTLENWGLAKRNA